MRANCGLATSLSSIESAEACVCEVRPWIPSPAVRRSVFFSAFKAEQSLANLSNYNRWTFFEVSVRMRPGWSGNIRFFDQIFNATVLQEALLELVKHLPNLSLRSSGRRLSVLPTNGCVFFRGPPPKWLVSFRFPLRPS